MSTSKDPAPLGTTGVADPDPSGGGEGKPPVPTPLAALPVHVPEGKTFDQVEVSAIATREHDRGNREGTRKVLEEFERKLDGATLDQVMAAYTSQKSAQDALKTEAQKALEEAQRIRGEAEADRATAKSEMFAARRTLTLTTAGVPTEAQDAITLPGITSDSTDDDIKVAVEALKVKIPALFSKTPIPKADPKKPAGSQPPSADFGSTGKLEFERRFPATADN